jgi:uncharacterized membrane protein
MRPSSSQIRGNGAGGLSLSAVAVRLAADEDPVPAERAKRLGVALAGLAQELAAARREIAVLKRETVALRARLDAGGLDG